MRRNKLLIFSIILSLIAPFLGACAKITPKKAQVHRISAQEFMQANIRAQTAQDARIAKKSHELDELHITGVEKNKQMKIEKAAAHKDFLQTLENNKDAATVGVTQ